VRDGATADCPASGSAPPPTSTVRTAFFGSGSFAVPVLEALISTPGVLVEAVVSVPDRPVGRKAVLTPTPVAARAGELSLPLLRPERVRAPDSLAALRTLAPDLAIVADYGQLIPRALIDLPPRGFLNLHPSALPRHRGAAPIPATILAGDTQSAVTLMVLSDEMDAGPIVAVEPLEVRPDDTAPILEARAAAAAARLLARALPDWLAGRLTARPQPADGVTLTRPLRREDGLLDPERPAEELERQVRAYQPWPGSYIETAAGRLVVWVATVCPGEPGDEPGTVAGHGPGLALVTAAGRLRLDEVQLAGKRRMSGPDVRRGYPGVAGKALAVSGGMR
jgi:methionyl-tRNA formyltransferase